MLWLAFAVLTIAVVTILLFPILKSDGKSELERVAYDIVVYRDQLAEIDEEIENGLMTDAQADAARAEIHRRMLAAEDAELGRPLKPLAGEGRRMQLALIVAIALVVPVGATAVYGTLGSPHLPGLPYAWRLTHEPQFASAATAEALAEQLNAHPDPDGYRRLASLYFTARDFAKAAVADKHAIDLGAKDSKTWSEYGEAVAMAADGMIVPESLVAFVNTLSQDPHDDRARFYVGLAETQIGNAKQAVAIWKDLLASAAPDAPWADMVRQHIATFAKQGGFNPDTVSPAPPSLDSLKSAVAGMSAAMQSRQGAPAMSGAAAAADAAPTPQAAGEDPQLTMIRGMVARLAARMEQNQGDAEGWRRLAHAYVVLGDAAKAKDAIAHGIKLRPDDAAMLETLAECQQIASPHDETPRDFIATLHRVLSLDPNNLAALYYIGLAEKNAGHDADARAMWNKALVGQHDANDPLMVALKNRLAAMTPR